jgi:hypothetical protein
MSPEELKDHLEQVHFVDLDGIEIPLEEAHAIDHDEWLAGDHEHEEASDATQS